MKKRKNKMKNKAYLEFKSLNNNLYIYDDVTSEILPWNETKSAILKAFERGEKKSRHYSE